MVQPSPSGGSLRLHSGRTPFVGRAEEFAALQERLAAARQGQGGIILISGEPGIGKTRLVAEVADWAGADGWTVLNGRAYQSDGIPPYLPFAEALREYLRTIPADALDDRLGEAAADVSLLVRGLRSGGAEPSTAPFSPETERYRLFESVTDVLLEIARGTPLPDPLVPSNWGTRTVPQPPPDGGKAPETPERAERASSIGHTLEPAVRQAPLPSAAGEGPGEGFSRPGLLLVLDDLHWADVSSLQLLLHLSRRLPAQPMLVIGAYRDMEVERGHPFADVLAELVRAQMSESLVLHGLEETDVRRFIELAAGLTPSPALAANVYRETEGNPLFVVELVSLLLAEGRLQEQEGAPQRLTIPRSVQQVIGRRLDRLSDECNRTLTFAAVIGREFSLPALEHAGDVRGEALLEVLEEAEASRVIAPLPERRGRYTFTHPLIRETLYGQVLSSRRVRLHRQVGEALERLYAAQPEPYLAELAHHFFQAAPSGDVGKAVDYARRAGDRSMSLFAYEEAARLYENALDLLTPADSGDERQRCELLLSLADAQARAGDATAGRETYQRAANLAVRIRAGDLLARVALGYGGFRGTPGVTDAYLVGLLEQAIAALNDSRGPGAEPRPEGVREPHRWSQHRGPGAEPRPEGVGGPLGSPNFRDDLRARLLARLAVELSDFDARERRTALSDEAVAVARRGGDPETLAAVLTSRHYTLHHTGDMQERMAATAEVIRLAEAGGDQETALQGHYLRLLDVLELGDMEALDQGLAAHERIAAELRQPFYLWRTMMLQAMRALLEGRAETAAALSQQAMAMTRYTPITNAVQAFAAQTFVLRWDEGALESLAAPIQSFVVQFPAVPAWRAALALLASRTGHDAAARTHVDALADLAPAGRSPAGDFAGLPRDDLWTTTVALLAEVCAAVRDPVRAAPLYDVLLPYAQRQIVVAGGAACLGAAARYLGLLATVLERWDDAAAHFEVATAINARMWARPWLIRTQIDFATMLSRRRRPGDEQRALDLLERARAFAGEIGMTRARDLAIALRDEITRGSSPPPTPLHDNLTEREVEVLRLLAAGHTNREIAAELVLSRRTVDHHIANIYRKINARRRADAAAYAQRTGLA